jgi:hypothetical protein
MYGAIVHTRACRGLLNSRNFAELLYSHTEAISELNKEMRDPIRACTDDNILAVVCLAHNGLLDASTVDPARSPSQAPLKSLQMLDLYGTLGLPLHISKGFVY